MTEETLKYTEHHYGEHELQKVGVWEFPESHKQDGPAHWIIFVHGGAWRDPTRVLSDFIPSIRALLGPSSGPGPKSAVSRIAGFASIDYRLSPHPQHPQDPAAVPATQLRNARHPDHAVDVRDALLFLQKKYPSLADRYVLVGHSAGATIAFQLLMGSAGLGESRGEAELALPEAIVGISGIFELRDLDARHGGGYASFIESAFGEDKAKWDDCMPACFSGSFKEKLGDRRVVLAWSAEDTLIDEPEIDRMGAKLKADGVSVEIIKNLYGEHDFVWEEGKQIARLIEDTVRSLS